MNIQEQIASDDLRHFERCRRCELIHFPKGRKVFVMQMLIAIIRPERFEAVQAVLQPQEACLLAASQVFAGSLEPAQKITYRGASQFVRPTKLRLEITVEDDCVDEVVDAISEAACDNGARRLDDGAIFVLPLSDCVRIGWNQQTVMSASS